MIHGVLKIFNLNFNSLIPSHENMYSEWSIYYVTKYCIIFFIFLTYFSERVKVAVCTVYKKQNFV